MPQNLNEAGSTVAAIKTVAELLAAAKDGYDAKSGKQKGSYSYSSVVRAASELTVVYPILMSKTVSKESAELVYKHIEQFGAMMLMQALQAANISDKNRAQDYLRQFHQNIDLSDAGGKELYKWVNSYIEADFNIGEYDDSYLYESDNFEVPGYVLQDLCKMLQENANIQTYDLKLNPISLNNYAIIESGSSYRVSLTPMNEAKRSGGIPYNVVPKEDQEEYQKDRFYYDRNKLDLDQFNLNTDIDNAHKNRDLHNQKIDYDIKKSGQDNYELDERIANRQRDKKYSDDKFNYDSRKLAYDSRELNAKMNNPKNMGAGSAELSSQVVNKFNAAVPTILKIKFYRSDGSVHGTEFIIGVKAKIVPCNSAEILRRIANDNSDGKSFINLLRTITGELKVSDYLFGLSRINDDLKTINKKGTQGSVWETLKNRSMLAKEQLRKGKQNDFAAITTVVISREDAYSLYREENIDITDDRAAYHFMQSYNLMAFAVVDDAIESVKLMVDDGNKKFEEFSFSMLSKESKDGDVYKKMINLMANNR